MNIKSIGIWCLRVVLIAVAMLSFFGWVPLLGSEPVSELRADQRPAEGVPLWAKSFHINHGQVVFNSFGTPSQSPVTFGLLVLTTIASGGILFFSFSSEQRRRFIRRRFGRHAG
jgi:hypothetical protein